MSGDIPMEKSGESPTEILLDKYASVLEVLLEALTRRQGGRIVISRTEIPEEIPRSDIPSIIIRFTDGGDCILRCRVEGRSGDEAKT